MKEVINNNNNELTKYKKNVNGSHISKIKYIKILSLIKLMKIKFGLNRSYMPKMLIGQIS